MARTPIQARNSGQIRSLHDKSRDVASIPEAAGTFIYTKAVQELTESSAAIESAIGPDDETLLLRMQASDMEALGLLFGRYSNLIWKIARRVLQDNNEAEDLVQDIFLYIIYKGRIFDPSKGTARSWLMQVTYHRAYDRRRYLCTRSYYHTKPNDLNGVSLTPRPWITDPEEFFAWGSYLQLAFEELSENQRLTLHLYFYEGYTLKEIGEKTGQSFGNVQHHFYRGMERLRKICFRRQTGSKWSI